MRRFRRWFMGLIALVSVCALGLGGVAAWEGADTFVAPRNPETPDGSIPDSVDHHFRFDCDDVIMDVFVIDPIGEQHPDAVDTALILHGKADQKLSMTGLGRRFARAGVRSVLVDMRGHGRSSRTWLTYGARDRDDLSCVLDGLERENIELGELGVYGASYGGAVALQFAGAEPRVSRVVAVAGFRSFDAIASSMIDLPGIAQWAVIQACGLRAGFDPDDASPEQLIRTTTADVVLVYSADDEIVPFSHAEAIAEACGERCRLVRLEGYDHLGTLSNPELRDILHRHLAARPYPPITPVTP